MTAIARCSDPVQTSLSISGVRYGDWIQVSLKWDGAIVSLELDGEEVQVSWDEMHVKLSDYLVKNGLSWIHNGLNNI